MDDRNLKLTTKYLNILLLPAISFPVRVVEFMNAEMLCEARTE